jgi:hypothetical protein
MSAEKKQKRVAKCTADAVPKKMHCICADFLALQMQCTFFSTAFFE